MQPQDVVKRLPVLLLAGTLLLSISACGKAQDTTAENEDYNTSIVEMSETPQSEEPSVSVAESTAESLESEETNEEESENEESENEESESPQDEVIPSEETVSETTENLESSKEAESEPVSAEPIVSEEVISPSPSVSYTYTDLFKTAYTTTALNVRSGPSTGFDKIGGYSNGAEISVTGQCNETGWYRVDYNSNIGYCDSSYTTDTKPVVQSSTPSNNTDSSSTSNNNNTSSATQYSVASAGDSGVSAYYVGLIQDRFNSLPQWVQTSFANHGWQIKARSGYWWTEFGWNVSLKGLTVEDYKTIYISARDDSANYHIVAHEVGHYIDWLYGWPSNSSEFNGIYNSEYKQFCNYYSYSNGYPGVEELFAEGLYHYWTDPGVLSSVAPQTYAFIQKTL